jgi:hypothetical protein
MASLLKGNEEYARPFTVYVVMDNALLATQQLPGFRRLKVPFFTASGLAGQA